MRQMTVKAIAIAAGEPTVAAGHPGYSCAGLGFGLGRSRLVDMDDTTSGASRHYVWRQETACDDPHRSDGSAAGDA
jgi:hypothetical protein